MMAVHGKWRLLGGKWAGSLSHFVCAYRRSTQTDHRLHNHSCSVIAPNDFVRSRLHMLLHAAYLNFLLQSIAQHETEGKAYRVPLS